MEKIIIENNKPVYIDTKESDLLSDFEFWNVPDQFGDNVQFALHTDLGSLTVLNRMTGFGYRDTETGFRDSDGTFWLASGDKDVRYSGSKTIGEAIQWVKNNSNTCVGVKNEK